MKTVFITGATAGIGQELARQYHELGWRVLFCARREDRLRELEKELETKRPGSAKGFVVDVTKETDFLAVSGYLLSEGLGMDLVIANAGFGIGGKFARLTNADYQRQFDTNIFGVLNTLRPFLEAVKSSRGQFAIIGSGNSYLALGGTSPYSMSKFAIRAFADSLWQEMRSHGVAVTLVCPGFVESEIRQVNNEGKYIPDAPDPIPHWIQVPAKTAAREVIRGIRKRKPEIWVTHHVKFFILLELLFPGIARWLKRKVTYK